MTTRGVAGVGVALGGLLALWWLVPLHWLPYALRTERTKAAESWACAHGDMADCLERGYGWPSLDAGTETLKELQRQQQQEHALTRASPGRTGWARAFTAASATNVSIGSGFTPRRRRGC